MDYKKDILSFKKAFTLGELVITFIIIGILIAMTMSVLTENINKAITKAAYKRAYSNISKIASRELKSELLPDTNSTDSVLNFYESLNINLKLDEFVSQETAGAYDNKKASSGDYYGNVEWGGRIFHVSEQGGGNILKVSSKYTDKDSFSPWIVTTDGMAYTIKGGSGEANTKCMSSSEHNSKSYQAGSEYNPESCITVLVDINGLKKGPNLIEPQSLVALEKSKNMDKFKGDRFWIYVFKDGVATGSADIDIQARILEDKK